MNQHRWFELLFSSFVFVFVFVDFTQFYWDSDILSKHTLALWLRSHSHSHSRHSGIQVILNLSQPEKWLDLSLSRSQSTSKRQIIFMISWELIQTTFRQSNKNFFFPIFTNCRISDQQKSPKNVRSWTSKWKSESHFDFSLHEVWN